MRHVPRLSLCLLCAACIASLGISYRSFAYELSPTPAPPAPNLFELIEPMDSSTCCGASPCLCEDQEDRFWLINTRGMTSQACRANLQTPELKISRLNSCGSCSDSSLDDYTSSIAQSPRVVIYAHGNRMESHEAVKRAMTVYRKTRCYRTGPSIDWVIWSWPSEQQGILAKDARLKAKRTDAQGLYLGWLLRRHAELNVSTAVIGYSFGGRVVIGSLHVLAGGTLGGRQLDGEPVYGFNVDAGLIAPALDADWMQTCGYHNLATKNLDRLLLLYNRKDAVLKRYWLLDRVRGESALGYTGPTSFASRFDGTRLPVQSRDCAPIVGLHHSELDYYEKPCGAGCAMATLIHDLGTTP
ncbi:hypothetical protein Pla22_22790 [Rubripirellula amarantea]|uniref:Alpha/beta hydrolase family protein n=1 Tax=Rubripirellula amarantea TaxID=2527999 RepID=A0A5C5WWN7_9BACT|nr:alpha/beta hydrolase [Rubripirellula amarantea]TWT54629.1 hypothetical protein Pla22_22790 [Rubripirellula amarantea]